MERLAKWRKHHVPPLVLPTSGTRDRQYSASGPTSSVLMTHNKGWREVLFWSAALCWLLTGWAGGERVVAGGGWEVARCPTVTESRRSRTTSWYRPDTHTAFLIHCPQSYHLLQLGNTNHHQATNSTPNCGGNIELIYFTQIKAELGYLSRVLPRPPAVF